MRRVLLPCLVVMLLCPCLGLAAETKDIDALIAASLKPGERTGKLQLADMCGGKVVVMNESAEYWVKDNIVFAVNGVAHGYSPKAYRSPPSVNHNTLQRAMAGDDITVNAYLNHNYLSFLFNVAKAAKALGLPPLKKDGDLGAVMKLPSGMKATVEATEVCGMLTKVTVLADHVIDGKDNDKTMALPMLIVPAFLAPDMAEQERLNILGKAMEQAAKKKGEYATFTLGNAQCQLIYLADGKRKGRFALEAEATQ